MRRPHTNTDSESAQCYDKSMSDEHDKNLLNFIATTVESLRERVDTISDQMATKVDLANLRDGMATKVDLANLRAEMATKEDLARVESGLVRVELNLATLDARTIAMRGDIEQVHIRLDSIDRGVGTRMGQVETDISRMRSVLYLLVKDKPDMLRLLGEPTPGESRP
jgi:hypothetical protein